MQADPYSLLELPWGASAKVIQRAFRRLALRYHPDRNPGDAESEQRFKLISAAYQRLKESDWQIPRQSEVVGEAGAADTESAAPEVRPEFWPDGARIYYPTPEEIDALLKSLGTPTLLGRLRSVGLFLSKAVAYLYVAIIAVGLLLFLATIVARLVGR